LGVAVYARCRCPAGRLNGEALRGAIAADRAAGATPALLVGSAGTVNTGAIDPLDALADVAAAERLWFHVDGAYGAFGVLDPAMAARYRGMERADSLTLEPHKWLGVPVDAGCALVRHADDLRDAFSVVPPYLRQDAGAEVGTFAEYGLERTRPFRALKTWATMPPTAATASSRRSCTRTHSLASSQRWSSGSRRSSSRPRRHVDRGVPRPATRVRAGPHRGGQSRAA
jgi:aromatic-L-amino-acid/L-tryptophan decarboxylase